MKAAVLWELGSPLTIEEVELPRLAKGQVLVRVQLSAVCHSQKLEVSGGRGVDRFLPHLIGHEGVGVVEDVGPSVTKVRPGDQVVLSWIRGSGCAADPISYSSKRGRVNAGPIATFCELPIVSEQCVTRIDPPVDPELAVLAGCAIPTGVGTVWNAMPAMTDGAMAVVGIGGVGLSAVWGAVAAGWGCVIAIDLHESRLQRARELGATHTVLASQVDTKEAVLAITKGEGCKLVLECAGSAGAMQAAIGIAKAPGGRVIIAGNLEVGKTIAIDPFDLVRGRWLGGSWGGGINPDVDIPQFVRLVTQGALPHTLLMGKRFALHQVNDALETLGSAEPGRSLLQCGLRDSSEPPEAQRHATTLLSG